MKQLRSDTCYIDKVENLTCEYIENELKLNYKHPVRWAVCEVTKNSLKINVTYETEA